MNLVELKKGPLMHPAKRVPSKKAIVQHTISKLYRTTSVAYMRSVDQHIKQHAMLARDTIPAYQKFLKTSGAATQKSKTRPIPPVSKDNYLRAYPWQELLRKDALKDDALVLTATSGSTGAPFYIPRTDELHEISVVFHQLFLERSGLSKEKKTLVVVCFGMGAWIGGLLTYEAFRRISERGTPLTVITPGVNKKEIFDTLQSVAVSYEQLILCGYPPFIKDVLDDGSLHGIRWNRWNTRIVCAAEAFSEPFRNHLMKKVGAKDPYRSVMNIYGSAELGTMASETPLTILLRRLALTHKRLYTALFSEAHRFPTLAQFIPGFVSFDAGENGELYATGGSAMPLVRYDIGDQGGVLSYEEVQERSRRAGIDLAAEIRKAGIEETVSELPFVYLYERKDLSTKLYGAIIYPEHIKKALQQKTFAPFITGRFTMVTEYDANHDEYLRINMELQHGVRGDKALSEMLTIAIEESLASNSDEYRYLQQSVREKIQPRITFYPHGDPTYFSAGIKQKWALI